MSKLQNVEKAITRIAQEGMVYALMSGDPKTNLDATVNVADLYLAQAKSAHNIVLLLEAAVQADLAAISAAETNPNLN